MKKNKQVVWNKKISSIAALPRLQGNSSHKVKRVWTVGELLEANKALREK